MEQIVVKNISKKFNIGFKKNQGSLARVFSFFSGREPKREIWAVKDVSFTVNSGEIAAITGPNGSGKSTLLRIVGGIYSSDAGSIKTAGRTISLIGLGPMLNDRLTLRDNIFLCCSFFGLGQNLVKKQFNLIIKFAELEKFINTKIYQFSDGMKARLVFSIAMHCDPKVLLLDEVFAVGDESFSRKGVDMLKILLEKNTTILLTTHNLGLIEKYLGRRCDRVIHMEYGKIKKVAKKS